MFRYELDTLGGLPIDLAIAKSFLKIMVTADDDIIQLIINDVSSFAYNHTGRELSINTWSAYANSFNQSMELRRRPIERVVGISYIKDGSEVVVPSSVYELQKDVLYPCLVTADGQSWPSDGDDTTDAVRIQFETSVDAKIDYIKLAMLRHIADSYENRGDDDLISVKRDPIEFYDSIRIPKF